MIVPDRLRLPLRFDATRLSREMEALEKDGWISHFVKSNYEGDWSVIPLRGPRGATHPVQMIYSDPSCQDFDDTPFLQACPYFREVLAQFQCPLHAVRLMRLGAGSAIKEHSDHDLSFEHGMVRIHIPVETNADVEFLLNGTRAVLEAGTAWYLRLSDPHSVANRGASPRVHLVIDAVVNDWVAGVFRAASEGDAPPATAGTAEPRSDFEIEARAGPEAATPGDFAALQAAVLSDARVQQELYQTTDQDAFLDAVVEVGRSQNLAISRPGLLQRMREKREHCPVESGPPPDLGHWMPADAFWRGDAFLVEWIRAGNESFEAASFVDSARALARRPFNRLFRLIAPVSSLQAEARTSDCVAPAGLIFHMSRSGSTLVSRQLGVLSGSIVVAEASPVDAVLRARTGHPALSEDEQEQWLKCMLAVLGRRRRGDETRFFVKLDSWNTLALPLIRRAFPLTPWIFLYREPVEVVISLMRQPALHIVPGLLPGLFGMQEGEPLPPREEHAARVLAEICEAACEHAAAPTALLFNYEGICKSLDAVLWHFGIVASPEERERMQAIAAEDAKRPYEPFAPDGASKRTAASAAEVAAAERWIGPVYRRLEERRRKASAAA